jgi:large subunit ribosomal protein L30
MAKIKITQIKSTIKRTQRQKNTIKALGLGKINRSVEHHDSPEIMGMVNAVKHLIKIEQI